MSATVEYEALGELDDEPRARALAAILLAGDAYLVQQSNGYVRDPGDLEADLTDALAAIALARYTAALQAWSAQGAARRPEGYPGTAAISAPGFLPYLGAPEAERNPGWCRATYDAWDAATQSWTRTWDGPTAGYARYVAGQARWQAIAICTAAMAVFAPAISPDVPGSTGPGPMPDAALYARYQTTYDALMRGQFTPAPPFDLAAFADAALIPVTGPTPGATL